MKPIMQLLYMSLHRCKTNKQPPTTHKETITLRDSFGQPVAFTQWECPASPCKDGGHGHEGTGHLQSHLPSQRAAASATQLLSRTRMTEVLTTWNKLLQKQSVSKNFLSAEFFVGRIQPRRFHSRLSDDGQSTEQIGKEARTRANPQQSRHAGKQFAETNPRGKSQSRRRRLFAVGFFPALAGWL